MTVTEINDPTVTEINDCDLVTDDTTDTTEALAPVQPDVWLDPRTLVPHPRNLRTNLGDLSELKASIAAVGILQPILVVMDGDIPYIVAGHRRTESAIELGAALVPVKLRPDLAGDVNALVIMLGENVQRVNLTVAEETSGYHQLNLLGLSAPSIAKATGSKVTKVRKSLKLVKSEVAAAVIDRWTLTLDQALAVAEFDTEPEAVKLLVATATKTPGQWDHVLSQLRTDRDDEAVRQATIDRLTEAGVTVIDWHDRPNTAVAIDRLTDDTGQPFDAESHADCPGHAASIVPWEPDRFVLFCVEPAGYGHRDPNRATLPGTASQGGKMSEEAKAERREVVANNKAWRAAEPVRRDFIATLLSRRTAPKGTLRFVTAAVLDSPRQLGDGDNTVVSEFLGKNPNRWRVADLLSDTTDARLPLVLLAQVAAALEHSIDLHTWRHPDRRSACWLTWLASVGYQLSEVEALVVDRFADHNDTDEEDEDEDQSDDEADEADDDADSEMEADDLAA